MSDPYYNYSKAVETEEEADPTAREIRIGLGSYPVGDQSIFMRMLVSACLTVEVFLRWRMGGRYFTAVNVFGGIFFILFCMLLMAMGVEFKAVASLQTPGFIRWFPVFELPPTWDDFYIQFREAWKVWQQAYFGGEGLEKLDPVKRINWADKAVIAAGLYGVAANAHFLVGYLGKRAGWKDHAYSSGEPWFIWNPIYAVGNQFHLETDVVKQVFEPLLVFSVAQWFLISSWSENNGLQFVGAWLYFASLALVAKAYFENRIRSREYWDQISSEKNAEASKMMRKIQPRKAGQRREMMIPEQQPRI